MSIRRERCRGTRVHENYETQREEFLTTGEAMAETQTGISPTAGTPDANRTGVGVGAALAFDAKQLGRKSRLDAVSPRVLGDEDGRVEAAVVLRAPQGESR
eukprot:6178117-Pleurochrysis_carterae.AAC.2